ncbi:MAG: DUF927 domain-containing protein [Anaerolineaceae bacterium]|nr:DUF927 domain-containing protein [Anaerolineaceae bacterium]
MTQNDVVDKTDTLDPPSASRREFLNALYKGSPEELYLELRCIHPTTGEARSLWGCMGSNRELSSALKQAEALNREGYGVYFAPCLRKTKQGKAASAALVPTLWVDIDCDGDAHQRNEELQKLRDFDPAPSFILDSGGGWHGYWLLNQPFQLQQDSDRQKIAGILHGLFAALGGDPEYVKTVAGIMRLPDSVNTKPERGGVVVTVIESHPERCYPLETFDWLESQSQKSSYDGLKVVTLNGNGHHPLPLRTETYLVSGATDGSRNLELFAAACQLRDAGYSQTDAERELIQRHLADGSSEREALATIQSAYSRPARDPIPAPREQARQIVDQLVSQFEMEQKTERPTSDQIGAAVEACIHLNPVEWAEERQRLKTVCGDGLKIGDIDRLYKEKKRASFQQREQEYFDTESYLLRDGKIIYRKESYRRTLEKTVVDWTATALYQTCQVDDDGKEAHTTALELRRGDFVKKLDVPGEVFVDDVALRRFIGANAGSQYVVRAGMSKHLVPAIVQLSGDFPTHRHYNFMGWMQLDGRWVYVSPQDCITAKGKLSDPPSVELDHRLRDYGLQATGWNESLAAFDTVTKVLPPKLASCLIAFALLPVLQRFFPAAAPRPAVHLVGTSGSGKSEIASLLSSFYGQFSRDTPPAQWGDTINTVETLGYPLADSLFWVDDYKSIYADEKTFTRFLQSYSRGMGRGRLTREAKVRHEKPCRGLILSTGETTIEGEMSVVARMLVLEIPPWEKRDPGGQALAQAERLREHLPGFTAHFASWIAKQLEQGDLKADIANRFNSNMRGYRERLAAEVGGQSNTGRVIQNWAVLVTVYQMLARFLAEMDEEYLLPAWKDAIVESVHTLRQERASEVFLDILGQLIAGGQAVLDDDMKNPREYPPGVTVVGYKDEGFVYLLPEIAHREVNRVQPLRFTVTAIGMQLREDGILIPGPNNLSTQKRVRGSRVRFWQLTSESFVETVETPETARS